MRVSSIRACSTRVCSARQHMQSAAKSTGSQCLIISAATSAGTPKSNETDPAEVSDDELPPPSDNPPRVRRLLLGCVLGASPTVSVDGGVELDACDRKLSVSVVSPGVSLSVAAIGLFPSRISRVHASEPASDEAPCARRRHRALARGGEVPNIALLFTVHVTELARTACAAGEAPPWSVPLHMTQI